MTDWRARAEAAEKTLEVLKEKVRSLYDRGPQTVIHRQIERARQRDQENLRRRAVAEARTTELQRYSALLEQQVEERTQALRTIFDHVLAGFLLVDRTGRVIEGFSRSCDRLLGCELWPGMRLSPLLTPDVRLQDAFDCAVDQVFDDILPEEVAFAQVQRRFSVAGRVLDLEGRAVRQQGEVVSIVFTLSDVTALDEARREARYHAALVGLAQQRTAFRSFLADSASQLSVAQSTIDDQAFARRVLHTVKGNLACFGLDDLVDEVHAVEGRESIRVEDLRRVAEAVDGFARTHRSALCLELDGLSVADRAELHRLLEDPVDVEGLARWRRAVAKVPIGELLGPHRAMVARLAERFGRVVTFEVQGADVRVDPSELGPVLHGLTHALRNAVDHGIEPPEARGNKPPAGKITVRVEEHLDDLTIEVIDDGRGVDWARLRSLAAARGLEVPADELLYLDGLSSKDAADDVSGRGVGMSALRDSVHRIGGTIRVHSEPGVGTTVWMCVPTSSDRHVAHSIIRANP